MLDEEIFTSLMSGVVCAVFVIVFVVILVKAAQKNKSANGVRPDPSADRRTEDPFVKQREKKARTDTNKHAAHVADALAHNHKGVEEHYEEIVGSLGDINDEGCSDLDGVRFIEHDAAYEADDARQRDYTQIAKAIVLGEILNDPRFKKPYRSK